MSAGRAPAPDHRARSWDDGIGRAALAASARHLRAAARRNDACGRPLAPLNARPSATEPSLSRSIPTLLFAAATMAALPAAAWAQDRPGPEPRVETAPKPAADTKDPGKTATDAVTHPSAVPPTEGEVGTGKPPATGTASPTGR